MAKSLLSYFKQSLKKIHIRKNNIKPLKAPLNLLINERNNLALEPHSIKTEEKLKEITKRISDIESGENRNIILKNFQHLSQNPEQINMSKMWKTLKRISPKSAISLPVAKRNHRGKIVSGPREIKKLLAREYKDRLRSRPMRPDLTSLKMRKTKIFKLKMKLAGLRRSPDWKMSDLELALKDLNNDKSRDHEGYINEIFKNNVIGENLKKSLLLMMNKLKQKKLIAKVMNFANITTVPKRGSRLELKNERGIFRVSVFRSILMRLMYNMKYPTVDRNMSDCQMGARKRKGCKNNIFILNGIIHEVLKSKKMKPVLFQVYDYAQMFDSIDLELAINDIYDTGVNDDTLVLLHKANRDIQMAVKTPTGLTERQEVTNIVLQGDTWGSLLASVQVDSIGKECMEAGHHYLYKDKLPVGFLGLVDDIIGITEAGYKAQELNAFINVKTAEKSLQFGPKKCKSMLVGKDKERVLNSPLFVDKWEVSYKDDPKKGELQMVEKYSGLTEIGQTEEQMYLGFVLSSQGDNMANIRNLKQKSIGIIRKIFSKINCLNLQKYYFECSFIMMNVMLRGSVLYACEMHYNLKENEIRRLQRIEENFMKKVIKLRGEKKCPFYPKTMDF